MYIFEHTFLFLTRGKTRENPYPRVEGTGFVRVQIWLPGPLPLCTLPMTPAGFQSHAIPYTPTTIMSLRSISTTIFANSFTAMLSDCNESFKMLQV